MTTAGNPGPRPSSRRIQIGLGARLTPFVAVAAFTLAFAAVAVAAVITGTNGPDQIRGTNQADQISALGGNDFVEAERGNDQVDGGTGSDKLEGNRGADTLNGGDARDELRGGPQNDTLNGENGRDNVDGQDGNDTLNGNAGPDDVRDNKGADTFAGGADADRVDARDSGGEPVAASRDTVICEDGDEVRVDRNDTIVNRAECARVERDGSGSGGSGRG
jgi:Ca2+-binding RTX toxin-like protein